MILTVVSILQIIFASVTVLFLKYGNLAVVDDLEWAKLKPYGLYIFAFVSSIFANMQALNVSNVETVIIFRSCTPIATSIIEYVFMNRDLPTLQSWASLITVGMGAGLYCMADSQLALKGIGAYMWVIIYFFFQHFRLSFFNQNLAFSIQFIIRKQICALLGRATIGKMW